MDLAFLRRLNSAVQSLVLDVERAAGIDIQLKVERSRDGRGPDGTGILACDIDEDGVTLLLPNEDYFPNSGVVHEMLHARRIIVDGVPRLTANLSYERWTPELENALADLDNAIEHWIILPEEICRCEESLERWRRILERTWSSDIPRIGDKSDQRRWALVNWALLEFALPKSSATSTASLVLDDLGLSSEASAFVDATRVILSDKERLVPIVLDHLNLPRSAAAFEYIDIAKRQSRLVPIR